MSDVSIPEVPALGVPNGHYSHATVHNGVVYVSGQLGRGPGMSDEVAGDVAAQTRRSLERIAVILRAADSDPSLLLRMTVYITTVDHWPIVNSVCAEVLGLTRPARSIVPVLPLHFGALVEIDAVAAVRGVAQNR